MEALADSTTNFQPKKLQWSALLSQDDRSTVILSSIGPITYITKQNPHIILRVFPNSFFLLVGKGNFSLLCSFQINYEEQPAFYANGTEPLSLGTKWLGHEVSTHLRLVQRLIIHESVLAIYFMKWSLIRHMANFTLTGQSSSCKCVPVFSILLNEICYSENIKPLFLKGSKTAKQ